MRNRAGGFILAGMLVLAGCAKSRAPDAEGETVTVKLKDGTAFTGTVTRQDNLAITLRGAAGESRTYQLSQVVSEKYADAAPAATPSSASQAPAAAGTNPSPTPASDASGKPAAAAETAATGPDEMRVIPAGTMLIVRNIVAIGVAIGASTEAGGHEFPGVIAGDVAGADGKVAIPKGANAMLVVRPSKGQNKLKKQPILALVLASIDARGNHYSLEGLGLEEAGVKGLDKNKGSAESTGARAVPGIVIGAVQGGGGGAPIGDFSFDPPGATTPAVTRGKSVMVPAQSTLSFKLEKPVQIRQAVAELTQ